MGSWAFEAVMVISDWERESAALVVFEFNAAVVTDSEAPKCCCVAFTCVCDTEKPPLSPD